MAGIAAGLVLAVAALTGVIGGVSADLNARQQQANVVAIQQQAARTERAIVASAGRLTAQAESYAAARRAEARETALTVLEDADAVVTVAAELLSAEAVSPLDEAVAELAALIEIVTPAVSSTPTPTVSAGETADLLSTSAVRQSPGTRAVPDVEVPAELPMEVPTSSGLDLDASVRVIELAAHVAELTEQVRVAADARASELAAAEAAAAEQAADEAALVAERTAADRARLVAAADASPNGAIPHRYLCGVNFDSGVLLRCDAAATLEELNIAFRAHFGRDLDVSSSYRDYSTQVVTKEVRGSLAAEPGTSNHGRGLAVDLNGFGALGEFNRSTYLWMKAHADQYGWTHPPYMGPGGSGPLEPWHWEYGTR